MKIALDNFPNNNNNNNDLSRVIIEHHIPEVPPGDLKADRPRQRPKQDIFVQRNKNSGPLQ